MRKLIFGKKYIQTADLNNSLFINNVAKAVTMNGKVTRTTDHKGGNTAIQFGSGNLVSVDALPASPVWSIAFWMKTTQTNLEAYLVELGTNYYDTQSFVAEINYQTLGSILLGLTSSPRNFKKLEGTLNNNTWRHFVIQYNRNLTANDEIILYVNGIKQILNVWNGNNGEHSGNFITDKLYIGGRGNSYSFPFNGVLSPIKMFNYALTQTEIDNLYNE